MPSQRKQSTAVRRRSSARLNASVASGTPVDNVSSPTPTGNAPRRKATTLRPSGVNQRVAVPPVADVKAHVTTAKPPSSNNSPALPWNGRLGYACLNTYLRSANPPIFSSRTCRLSSIEQHSHPLKDPTLPYHATKNPPDPTKPASRALAYSYLYSLGLQNVRDTLVLIRWNERYGIRFLRLSSDMFPFASHAEWGYRLGDFADQELVRLGELVGRLDHRVTMHPGQYTQLASPRTEVVDASIRELVYHADLLRLMKLPPHLDRDAVLILHMGGVFGSKEDTVARFKKNWKDKVPDEVKRRIVLENDDVSWSVQDLLPVCSELEIPLVLDFHHHSIVHDAGEGADAPDPYTIFPAVLATWRPRGITPKMHHSEPCAGAVTPRKRRKHAPRVERLPPCPDAARFGRVDLMIEAKDKEQAVFELMRKYGMEGWERWGEVRPFERGDERGMEGVEEGDVAMGGKEGRVYWPMGSEEWLRPRVRKRVKKEDEGSGAAEDAESPVKKRRVRVKSRGQEVTTGKSKIVKNGVNGVAQKEITPRPAKSRVRKKSWRKGLAYDDDHTDGSSVDGDGGDDFVLHVNPTKETASTTRRRSARIKL